MKFIYRKKCSHLKKFSVVKKCSSITQKSIFCDILRSNKELYIFEKKGVSILGLKNQFMPLNATLIKILQEDFQPILFTKKNNDHYMKMYL